MSEDKLDKLALEGLEELRKIFFLPERQKGDLDIAQISEDIGCSVSTAGERMKKLEAAGEWHSVKVKGANGGELTVYRKGAKPDDE